MKRIITGLAVFFALTCIPGAFVHGEEPLQNGAPTVQAAPEKAGLSAETRAEAFDGERLIYKIGFWFFDEVAEGSISLKKEDDGTYTGTIEAHTKGTVKKLILDRKDTYVSHMELSDDGQRFITRSFEEYVTMRGKSKKIIKTFDYENSLMKWKKWDKDGTESAGEISFPDDINFYDPIAAFYNFRAGAYGDVERGREYVIHSMPKEDNVPNITIRVATREDIKNRSGRYPDRMEFLADAIIDKELFGSKSGEIEIYFTNKMLPVYVVAKDLVFFGDVRGTLKRTRIGGKVKMFAFEDRSSLVP